MPKSVVHVIPSLSGGGAEPIALRIAEHQISEYDVHLVTWLDASSPGNLDEHIRHHRITKSRTGLLGALQVFIGLRRVLKSTKATSTVSHLHYPNCLTVIAALGLRAIRGQVLVHHLADGRERGMKLHRLIGFVYRLGHPVAVSKDVRSFLAREYGVVDAKVLANPLVLPAERRPIRMTGGQVVKLVASGRFVAQKNYGFLLDALELLPDAYLLSVAGTGDSADFLHDVEFRGLSSRVTVLGQLPPDRLMAEFADSHAFVMSSDFEGEPVSLLEAAAVGIPVVGRPTPGLGAAVHKVGGFMACTIDTPAEFAQAITRAVEAGRNTVEISEWRSTHDSEVASHEYCLLLEMLSPPTPISEMS